MHAMYEYNKNQTESNQVFETAEPGKNTISVTDGKVCFHSPMITKNAAGEIVDETSAFLGTGGKTFIHKGTITSLVQGSNGVKVNGQVELHLNESMISTTRAHTIGINGQAGKISACQVNVATIAPHSPAVVINEKCSLIMDQGYITTTELDSTGLTSRGDVSLHDVKIVTNASEAIEVHGNSFLKLFACEIKANKKESENDTICFHAGETMEKKRFYMIGGSLCAEHGNSLIMMNHANANLYFEDVEITVPRQSERFLEIVGNTDQDSHINLTAVRQMIEGDLLLKAPVNMDIYLCHGSCLNGRIEFSDLTEEQLHTAEVSVHIDRKSTWVVKENSYVTNLYQEGEIVDDQGNQVTILAEDGSILVKGNGELTVIVHHEYRKDVNIANVLQAVRWETYAMEKPKELVKMMMEAKEMIHEKLEDTKDIKEDIMKKVDTKAVLIGAVIVLAVVGAGCLFTKKR